MTKPKPANPALSISHPDLASALEQIGAEVDHQPLRSSALARIIRETFHGSDAGGAWDWRMAYDLMQAAAVQVLLRGDGAAGDIAAAKLLASRLLTETRRSEQQIRLQQFSTPLAFATMAVRAAAIRKGETVLEPSAGTGALAAFVARAGATLMLNEIDPFRQRLLRAVFGGEVTGHDGEHIDDLLQTPVLPDVVVMNPPFASSVDRSRDKHIAAKHLVAAAKRLAPGGRLVAIMPPGFTSERDVAHWSRACSLLTPRLALTMPGQVYRKLGTSVGTQLMIFDKVQEDCEMIRAIVCDLDEALPFVDTVAATRTEMRPVQQAAAIPNGRPTVPSSAPRKTAAAPVAASKPRANAVVPLTFTSLDIPRDNTPISDIYARYRPQRIEIAGAQEHPTPLVESIAMASVAPPVPSNTGSDDLRLPARLIEEGHLSEAQLETIVMAHDAHGRDLPGRFAIDDDQTKLTRADDDPDARAYRLGYFLGDGTGCGKGRECAGLILVNWLAGRRKAIWVSKSATLIEDAIRDWTDLGGSPADIQPLSKWKPDQPVPMGDGILFVTYATLRSAGKCGTTRLSQILAWMGEDFDGVLSFDEAHAMQNAAGSEQGRGVKPSQQGLAGLRLQLAAPRSRVFYISATRHVETAAAQYTGMIHGARFDIAIQLEARAKMSERSPDFDVTAVNKSGRKVRIGTAWNETGNTSGNPYISMQIDVGLGPFRVNAVQTKEARTAQSGEFEIIPLVSNGLMKSGSISGELTAMDADNAFTGYIANMMFDLEFMLIENSYKTEQTHPDYRIEVSSPRGTPIRVGSAWMAKSSRTGNDYLSLLINTPDGDLRVNAVQNEEQRGGQTFSIIPFIDSGEQPQDAGAGLSLVA